MTYGNGRRLASFQQPRLPARGSEISHGEGYCTSIFSLAGSSRLLEYARLDADTRTKNLNTLKYLS